LEGQGMMCPPKTTSYEMGIAHHLAHPRRATCARQMIPALARGHKSLVSHVVSRARGASTYSRLRCLSPTHLPLLAPLLYHAVDESEGVSRVSLGYTAITE